MNKQSKKSEFSLPYIGIDKTQKFDTLYNVKGDFGAIIKVLNPVMQYSADPNAYDNCHQLYINIIKILGEGYVIQKQDVLSKKNFDKGDSTEYLQKRYDEHFKGREFIDLVTYLTITKKVKKGAFYTFNPKALTEFYQNIEKVVELFDKSGLSATVLNEAEINNYIMRVLSMNFKSPNVSLNNMQVSDEEIKMGNKGVRSISLVNIDVIDLPETITTHITRNDKSSLKGFPIDTLGFLLQVPNFDTIIYNQVIDIPNQNYTQRKLELKKKRHSGIPDPANSICVEDINQLLIDVARENQMLVEAHFNILVCSDLDKLQQTSNYIESSLFQQGIIPSKNAYNQLELFRSVLPGNTAELKSYDLFLTTSDAALCFFFKEALSKSEDSTFQIRFTDRQGVPVAIDPADLPMQTNRINNRNKFILGPSGSGKSFFMNALLEQYCMHNNSANPKWLMDVVIVDTGHSYSGLCSYFGGKYITYSEEKPITMNPFAINEDEYNIEKKDFLITLISLLWKGAEGHISQVERDVISQTISAYYSNYFSKPTFNYNSLDEETTCRLQAKAKVSEVDFTEEAKKEINVDELREIAHQAAVHFEGSDDERLDFYQNQFDKLYQQELQKIITDIKLSHEEDEFDLIWSDAYDKAKEEFMKNNVFDLSFNSFYEYALVKIPQIKKDENIPFEVEEFKFVLKKFYKGGEFDSILNEQVDNSLFTESFIVFEIDSIKEHRTLFPIVTLIIMDVFIQKMRFRSDRRKALIIEEAWKAIASPLMANYILYLYKTVRKFWGEAMVVTQELGDIIGNAVVKDSIINNSDTIIMLDQRKFLDSFDEIAKLLSINDIERKKLFTINQLENTAKRGRFKEVYIRRGAVGEVYGVEVSIFQYLTYTTEKPEKSAVEIYVNYFGSYEKGLNAFVPEMRAINANISTFCGYINKLGVPFSHPAVQIYLDHYPDITDAINSFSRDRRNFKQSLKEFLDLVVQQQRPFSPEIKALVA